MRICHLSKKKPIHSSDSSKKSKYSSQFHKLFNILSYKMLSHPLKQNQTLKSHQIIPENDSLPFNAFNKLCHAFPLKGKKLKNH